MANVFVVSDTHFGHANILTFKRQDGSPLRSFKDVNHMNETMIERWNSVVRPQDKVYHLGDVVINPNYMPMIARCNGHKRLVLGNHDPKHFHVLSPYFETIHSSRILDKLMFTHVPVHQDSIRGVANVHGHVHSNDNAKRLGPRYFNVCVEEINYTPVSLEDLKVIVRKQQQSAWGSCYVPGEV